MTTNVPVQVKRQWLLETSPQTFWFSVGFGLFNSLVGAAAFNAAIFKTVTLVSIIPLKAWGAIFFVHGLAILFSLLFRDWRATRLLHVLGIVIKTGWWFEMLAYTVSGHSPFLFYTWSLLIFFQFTVFLYFTPRTGRDE